MLPYFDENWTISVYTVIPPDHVYLDENLVDSTPENIKIISSKIWEPYQLYNKWKGEKKNKTYNALINAKPKKSWKDKLALFIRANFFIPDARKFWIKPSVRFLTNYWTKKKFDIIISTGPPHTTHLIAMNLKKKLSVTWIADFRDPWTDIVYYDSLPLLKYSDSKHKSLEKAVLLNADKVVTVSKNWAKLLGEKVNRNDVRVINNGYDEKNFADINKKGTTNSDQYTILHIGSITKERNPIGLWQAIKSIKDEHPNISAKINVELVGAMDGQVNEFLKKFQVDNLVSISPPVAHFDAIRKMYEADLLLVSLDRTPSATGHIPSKFYEYLRVGKKILALGPFGDSDIKDILKATDSGELIAHDDSEKIVEFLLKNFQFRNNKLDNRSISQYSREALAIKYQNLIKEIIQHL